MSMDSFMIAGMAKELNLRLAGSRLDKVNMPRRDRIVLQLRTAAGQQRLLLCTGSDARVQLTAEKYDNPDTPPMLCMLLRKHMAGARIVGVSQLERERALEIRFTAADEMGVIGEKRLICELMGRMTNLILVGQDDVIVACLRSVDYERSDRAVLPGLIYRLPPPQEKPSVFGLTEAELRQLCEDNGCEAARLCGAVAGLSPLLSREAVYRGGGTPAGTAQALLALMAQPPEPWLIQKDGKPFDIAPWEIRQYPNTECIKYSDFSVLFDSFYAERTKSEDLRTASAQMVKTMTTVRNRLQRKLAGQRQELRTAEEREKLKHTADLITANLYAIQPGQTTVTLVDYFAEGMPETKVSLDPQLTPQQNAQRMFKKYTRLKHAEEMLSRQIALGEEELAYAEAVLYSLSAVSDGGQIAEIREELTQAGYCKAQGKGRRKPRPLAYAPRQFTVEGDFTVYCGRNNRENDELTNRRAGKNDLWFHVRNAPGSHAVLVTAGGQPSETAIRQAASIAAWFSSISAQPRAAVDYTTIRHVKKQPGGKPGMVHYFEYQTALVSPELPKNSTTEE